MINKDTYERLTKVHIAKDGDGSGFEADVKWVEPLSCDGDILHRLAEFEDKIENGEIIFAPKYKLKQIVYWVIYDNIYWKGQIEGFDVFTQKYLIYFDDNDDIGFCEAWCCESELFATKKQAQARLKELQEEK